MVLTTTPESPELATIVTYTSHGNTLIIGSVDSIRLALDEFPSTLTRFILLTDSCDETLSQRFVQDRVRFIDSTRDISVSGYLGTFRVTAVHHNQQFSVNQRLMREDKPFDVVLDFQSKPSISRITAPIGYYRLGLNIELYRQTLNEFAELTGEFEKPKFFQFNAAICAHDRNSIEGCSRCINACPAEAITSVQGKIEVNPFLCQGCGSCVTTCPSGALNYRYPSRTETLNNIRRLVGDFSATKGFDPILVFHEEADGETLGSLDITPSVVLVSLESVASVGMEIWLAALAFGAKKVKLYDGEKLSELTRQLLQSQMNYSSELLSPIMLDPDAIGWITEIELRTLTTTEANTHHVLPAKFAGVEEKRRVVRMAIDHLGQSIDTEKLSTQLSNGAPFGELKINSDACTLCMACVSICPEGALHDGHDQPQLKFIEANCVQCSLCANVCPEQAITLAPRYLYNGSEARQAKVIHEDAVFHCIECGKGFATKSMIENMMVKLKNHPAFQSDNGKRLKMCGNCRIKALF